MLRSEGGTIGLSNIAGGGGGGNYEKVGNELTGCESVLVFFGSGSTTGWILSSWVEAEAN